MGFILRILNAIFTWNRINTPRLGLCFWTSNDFLFGNCARELLNLTKVNNYRELRQLFPAKNNFNFVKCIFQKDFLIFSLYLFIPRKRTLKYLFNLPNQFCRLTPKLFQKNYTLEKFSSKYYNFASVTHWNS